MLPASECRFAVQCAAALQLALDSISPALIAFKASYFLMVMNVLFKRKASMQQLLPRTIISYPKSRACRLG